jgi:hypothetical protein
MDDTKSVSEDGVLSCADVRELIGNDLDRELTVEMHARVHAHLDKCDECNAEAMSLAQSLEKIRIARGQEPAAPWFVERTLGRVLAEYDADAGEFDDERDSAGQLELWPGAA